MSGALLSLFAVFGAVAAVADMPLYGRAAGVALVVLSILAFDQRRHGGW